MTDTMNNKPFDARSDARLNHDAPGLGDDIQRSKCGAALDTGLECTECGHDMQMEIYPKHPEINWHALGMNWALQDARTQGPGEWVIEDLARAFAAGAKTAIGSEIAAAIRKGPTP